ncbi:MAG TPA: tellurite resistance TerB family protein [Steroidobacteraceae bacterium]|nr:tellurite resistance TerB family protein [Steroidobacteraceae bacterium]
MMKFANDSEAFLSVLTLVAGADQSGSLEERDFLFNKVKGLAIFGSPSTADFSKLLGKVTDAVYSGVAQQDGEFTAAGIESLLGEVKKTLSAELRKTLVQVAVELGGSDGADAKETALLGQIRRALG